MTYLLLKETAQHLNPPAELFNPFPLAFHDADTFPELALVLLK